MGLVQKSFSDIITFSRSSNATRVGPTGVLEYAPHNLILQSEAFATTWSTFQVSVTSNAAAAPNGTVTADALTATGAPYGVCFQSVSVTANVTHTFSVYVKAGTNTSSIIGITDTGSDYYVIVNLSTGVISTISPGVLAATITSVGNGWYRITVTRTTSAASINGFVGPYAASGSVLAWGAQLSVGPYALDYTPTTSAAVYGPRFDYNGSGVTIVEPVSRNLFLYSEDVASWSGYSSGPTITSNSATSPVGTQTADRVVLTASDFIYQRYLNPVAGSYCYSIWLKADANTTAFFRIVDDGIPTSATLSVAVTTTWQRITLPITLPSSSSRVDAGIDQRTAVGGPGTSATVYLWGAQLEVGSTATAYMVSGSTNGFRAVPVVSGSATARGLLIEEQRTNLLTYSEQFDNAAWTKGAATISANATAAPDGTVTADNLIEDTSTGQHFIGQSAGTYAAGSYTFSFYVKAAGRFRGECTVGSSVGGSNGFYASFNLTAGTATLLGQFGSGFTGSSATLTNVGNGWYRFTLSGSTSVSSNIAAQINLYNDSGSISYTGNGTSGLSIWGAQLEAGSFATSLIPTLASSVTRSADVASVNTLSPWFNASTGTVYAEFDIIGKTSTFGMASQIDDGTLNNRVVIIGQEASGGDVKTGAFINQSGASEMSEYPVTSMTVGAVYKSALAFATNNCAITVNGASIVDSSVTLPTGLTTTRLGSRISDGYLNGHLRRFAFYPRRLTASELTALTA